VAYRAEIEIGVKGVRSLEQLRSELNKSAEAAESLNKVVGARGGLVQSIQNYVNNLNRAQSTLSRVTIGTKAETKAIQEYVTAVGQANASRERQNKLIDAEIRKRQEAARIQKLTAAGIFETTRFARPIGPGPAVPAGGFPTAGMQAPPGMAAMQKRITSFGENLALGAGFPLLFGGGAGSVAGSVLGSFVGPGFGGQILGGAIGQILDQAVQKTAQLGSAMRALDLSKIEESGIRINANLETQVSLMRQAGDLAGAQAAIQQRVLNVTGALPGTVEGISDAVNVLGSAWDSFTAAAGVTLGIIGAPFAAALGAAFEIVNALLRGFNLIVTALTTAIRVAGEWVIKLLGGENALAAINNYLKQNNQELEKARATYAPILADLNGEILLTRSILDLEKQKTTSNKQRNAEISYGQQLLRIDAEIDKQIREEKEKQTEATKLLVDEKIRQLNVTRNQKKEEAEITHNLERRRLLEQEAAERAREADQAQKARLNAARNIFEEQLKSVDIVIREQEYLGGQEESLRASLKLTEARGRLIEQSLSVERDLALQEAAKNGTTQETLRLYNLKLENAQNELNLQTAITERTINRLSLERELAALQRQRDIQQAVQPIQQQQERTRLDIAGFTQPQDVVDRERLLLDQRIRAAQTLLPIQERITDLTLEISRGDLDTQALAAKQADLAAQQQKLTLLTNELTLLDQLEAKQLQLQQFSIAYGQVIQSVSGEMANLITFSVSELVRGTKSAQEIFADFLNSVGNALLQAAQQMIAQYIAIGIARIFAGLGGAMAGGGALPGSAPQMTPNAVVTPTGFQGMFAGIAAKGAIFSGNTAKFAKGGLVTSPTAFTFADGGAFRPGLMGEAGPEAIMPLQRGPDGKLGVQANGLREALDRAPGSGSGSPILNMSFETTTIGGVEYVSREQLEQAMAETRRAASRDGAQRGMTMTLDRIQNSSSTRRRIGV
jgi:hypothetical protein